MSDYKQTREAAGTITKRYENMLRDLTDEYVDNVTVASLMDSYDLIGLHTGLFSEPDKDEGGQEIEVDHDLLAAIEKVLGEVYMNKADFNAWMLTVKDKFK
jgi:hypothetical protein